jgi:hypothetical protein
MCSFAPHSCLLCRLATAAEVAAEAAGVGDVDAGLQQLLQQASTVLLQLLLVLLVPAPLVCPSSVGHCGAAAHLAMTQHCLQMQQQG